MPGKHDRSILRLATSGLALALAAACGGGGGGTALPESFPSGLPISRVTVASNGTEADDYSAGPGVSADGRYVAFRSLADNLVAGDTNGSADAFVAPRP